MALLAWAAAPAAADGGADVDLLEFLGSFEGDDDAWLDYFLERDTADPIAAETQDAD